MEQLNFDLAAFLERAVDYSLRFGVVLVFIALAWLIGAFVRRMTRNALTKARVDQTLTRFLSNIARWAVIITCFVICLSILNVQTGSFAAAIGAAGLAIGLAFQNSLSNLAAGIMILLFRPFRVGDALVVGGYTGEVDETDIMMTTLDTFDGRRLVIPNNILFTGTIENLTYHEERRVEVVTHTLPSIDIEQVKHHLHEAIKLTDHVLQEPAIPVIHLTRMDMGVLEWRIRLWTPRSELTNTRDQLQQHIVSIFREHDIEIPFRNLVQQSI